MFSKVIFHLKIGSRLYKPRRVSNCVMCGAMQFVCKMCCHKVLMFCLWGNAVWAKTKQFVCQQIVEIMVP